MLERDIVMASMNRNNDYNKQNLFECTFEHVSIVLRQTWKNVKRSFNYKKICYGQLRESQSLFHFVDTPQHYTEVISNQKR